MCFFLAFRLICNVKAQGLPGLDPETILAQLGPCATDLFHMLQMQFPDSALMIDASGKNVNSLGKYDECLATKSGRCVTLRTREIILQLLPLRISFKCFRD